MDNNNPANMSNMDLEKDMEKRREESEIIDKVQEEESSKINKITAFKADEEQDLDDLVHTQAKEVHNGILPDPEEAKLRGE